MHLYLLDIKVDKRYTVQIYAERVIGKNNSIKILKIFVDGGTKGSRICIVDGDTEIIKYRKHTPTNNELEYLAVLYALGYVRDKYKGKNITIYSDSKLIVNQLTGKWRVTTPSLKPLWQKCTNMLTKKIKIIWTPREFNRAGWVLDRPF